MTDDERLLLLCAAQIVTGYLDQAPLDMRLKLQKLINHVEAEDPSGLRMSRLYTDEWQLSERRSPGRRF